MAVLGIDNTGMIAYANAQAERLWPESGLIGNDAADCLPPDLLPILNKGEGSMALALPGTGLCQVLCQCFGDPAEERGLLLLLWPQPT